MPPETPRFPSDDSESDARLIEAYFTETCSSDERAVVERWMAESPSHANRIAAIRHAVQYPLGLDRRSNHESLWDALQGQLQSTAGRSTPRRVARPTQLAQTRTPLWQLGMTAAAVFGSLVLGTWFYHPRTTPRVSIYQTMPGQRSTVRFPDGSSMILGPATTVASTATNDRVDVTGEAYFAIAPHAARPLIVRTSTASVRVLGTRFSVRHYAGEIQSNVVVEEGKVSVGHGMPLSSNAGATVLSEQMMAQISDSGVSVSTGISPHDLTGWTQGTLVFRHAPLRDVVVELGRVYGANIQIADSALADQTFIAEVDVKTKPLPSVLNLIGLILDAHYVQHGSSFILVRGRDDGTIRNGASPNRRYSQQETSYGR